MEIIGSPIGWEEDPHGGEEGEEGSGGGCLGKSADLGVSL